MSKQQWKNLSLLLASLLLAFIIILSVPPISNKLMAQVLTAEQCGVPTTDWAYTAIQNVVEKYGIAGADVCQNGRFDVNHPEVRADIADWLSQALDRMSDLIAASTADLATKENLATLENLYSELIAEVETLEKASQ